MMDAYAFGDTFLRWETKPSALLLWKTERPSTTPFLTADFHGGRDEAALLPGD